MYSRVAGNEAWLAKSMELYQKTERENGAFARKIREEQSITLRSLAASMGVSAMFLSHLERGMRHWTPDMLAKWKSAIDVVEPKL